MPKAVTVGTNGVQIEKLVGPPAIFSDAAPTGTFEAGQQWVDTLNGITYTWYVDANSSQWVEFGESAQGAVNPIDGGGLSDTYVGSPYAFDGGSF